MPTLHQPTTSTDQPKTFATLTPGDTFTGCVAVKKCNIAEARNGTQYLDLTVTDGHSDMPAKVWGHTPGNPVPKENSVIYIQSLVNQYQGTSQLTIGTWRNAKPGEYEARQFIPVCPVDMDRLWDRYMKLCDFINDAEYTELLNHYIFHPFAGINCDFCNTPAATGIHHAYIHGLLEHSIGVAEKALAMADEATDIELLITGALLHDVGKVRDYDWSGCVIERSTSGKLMGHIIQGVMMLAEYYTLVGMDIKKVIKLSHLIASHHGCKEWGSPVEPQTKEAIILHHADMLDYQMNVVNAALDEAKKADPEAAWTGKLKGIGREFYAK